MTLLTVRGEHFSRYGEPPEHELLELKPVGVRFRQVQAIEAEGKGWFPELRIQGTGGSGNRVQRLGTQGKDWGTQGKDWGTEGKVGGRKEKRGATKLQGGLYLLCIMYYVLFSSIVELFH